MEDALTSCNYRAGTANGSCLEPQVCTYQQGAQNRPDSLSNPETHVAATIGRAIKRRHRRLYLAVHRRMVQSLAASYQRSTSPHGCTVDECTCARFRAPSTCGPSSCSLVRTQGQKRAALEYISRPRRSAALDTLEKTLHPLFDVSVHGHAWRVGHGDAIGALLDMLGQGSCAGRICEVCVSQVGGFYNRVRFFRVLVLSLCSLSIRSSATIMRFK
ncbi:hypothetical protein EDB87DRAFT_1659610 [Lactarius vividus]|nr:hypothetical protein EDB87DRAFT_1659610 [Lactarius vividus]